jgi:glycosyltransferase involved in cell wall biosynthesis
MKQPAAKLELSIVMPSLNEAETLPQCIEEALSFIKLYNIAAEVLIADNDSSDQSREIARRLGGRVINVATRGYGSALMGGIKAACGRFVIMGDADGSYDFGRLLLFMEKLREGYDLVIGNRFEGGIKDGAMPALHRYIGNPLLSCIGRKLFHAPIRDFHCGLRGFRRDAILDLNLRQRGMEFASEMIIKASLKGLRITQVPTILRPDGRSRAPHLRTWSDGWRHLIIMLLYCPLWSFLYSGLLLILGGGAVYLWLLPGSKELWGLTSGVLTLLCTAMIIVVGYQAVTWVIFARIVGIPVGIVPCNTKLEKVFSLLLMEKGLVVGMILGVLGMLGSVYAVILWRKSCFGALNPQEVLRVVIPSLVLIMLGFQAVLNRLCFSFLNLCRR